MCAAMGPKTSWQWGDLSGDRFKNVVWPLAARSGSWMRHVVDRGPIYSNEGRTKTEKVR